MSKTKKLVMTAGGIIAFILLLSIIFGGFFEVGPGEKGVVFNRGVGVENHTYEEGWHWKVPFWESAEVFSTRVQKYEKSTSAASNDLQEVTTKVALNYHLSEDKVHDMYRNIGPDYKSRIIDPAIEEVLKAVTARYNAQKLIQDREKVKKDLREMITKRLERSYLNVDEVSIKNFQFTKEFAQAIEEKEIANQKALEEKNRLKAVKQRAKQKKAKASGEADAMVEEAKGEAEAIKKVSKELSEHPEYIRYLMIKKWDGQTQTIRPLVEGGSSGLLAEVPLDDPSQE